MLGFLLFWGFSIAWTMRLIWEDFAEGFWATTFLNPFKSIKIIHFENTRKSRAFFKKLVSFLIKGKNNF